jgi:hypothetical protein
MISVSKLCCPVCWELLKILNDDGPQLSFPGCHPTIYPVELPEWLPPPIVDKMTGLFKGYLRRELNFMVQGVEEKKLRSSQDAVIQKKHHVSHESESNISVASTTRDSDDDSVLKEWIRPRAQTRRT